MRLLPLLGLFSTFALAADTTLEALLQQYRVDSDLSNITKQDSAGIIDVFTRNDLEKMQARTLMDVLKTVPTIMLSRTPNNLILMQKLSSGYLPSSAVRLYINDHDMTSVSFASAMLIWGDMPIEVIDHIEIYKGSSAIAFGNEPGTFIIKLYTKDPSREEGGKIKVWGGKYGSYEGDGYIAHTLENGLSYLLYLNGVRDRYRHYPYEYYDKKSGKKIHGDASPDGRDQLFYGSLQYRGWRWEMGHYGKHIDNYFGLKLNDEGGLEAEQSYIHLSRQQDDYKFEISYDWIDYEREYRGGLLIPLHGKWVDDYYSRLRDHIFNIGFEKSFRQNRNELMVGGFYKSKSFHQNGSFDTNDSSRLNSDYETTLNLYSLYLENRYDISRDDTLILSLKGDYYDYETDRIDDRLNWSARIGYLSRFDDFFFKFFVTRTYLATGLYKLYGSAASPYPVNPDLKYTKVTIASAELIYTSPRNTFSIRIGNAATKDVIRYDPKKGIYDNIDRSPDFIHVTLSDTYRFDRNHRVSLSYFIGKNDIHTSLSPRYGAIVRLVDTFDSVDLYNEFNIKGPYDYPVGRNEKIHEDLSVEYTAAVTWHLNEDLSIALKGENILNDGYKQIYGYVDKGYPVVQQRFWINLEYLF